MKKERGLLVVLSSPSGGGKTTVIKKILEEGHPDYVYSISMTTRPIRPGEVDGKDYLFVTDEEFKKHIQAGDLTEYEKVHGWYYGTPKIKINEWLAQNKVVFLDIDVHGALRIKRQFGERAFLIFLKPPDEQALVDRLLNRSTETKEQIRKRLARVPEEMKMIDKFDAVIINDKLDDAVQQVKKLVQNKMSKN